MDDVGGNGDAHDSNSATHDSADAPFFSVTTTTTEAARAVAPALLPPLRINLQASSIGSSTSVTASTSDGGSIFVFHPSMQHKKKAVTPRAATPRNVVFPEPAAAELPVAQARVYTPVRADTNTFSDVLMREESDTEAEMHRRSNRQLTAGLSVPTSARMYRSPRPDGESLTGQPDPSLQAGSDTSQPHRRVAVLAPRDAHGKLQFHYLRALQHVRYSLRTVRLLLRQLHTQQKLAYVQILCGMLSESATPAPRYNVPIGIAIFLHPTSRFDHRTVVSGLCLAIFIDVVWLLRPQERSFNGYFRVQYLNFAHACLGICTLIKVGLVFSTYSDLGPEPLAHSSSSDGTRNGDTKVTDNLDPQPPARPHHPMWRHVKFFFPRKTYPPCSHLSFEVLMRTLALVWLHGLCGAALLVLGIVSAMFYAGKVQFRATTFGAPLHLMMVLRATTTLASYLVATQHMSYSGCLKLFGCRRLAELGDSDDGSGSDIVLKYNRRWLRRMQRVKALDALVGVYFLLVFYSAFHSGQFFAGSGVTAVLVLTAVVVLVLDFWVPLLLMVVAKCGAALHAHHKRGTVDVDPYYPNQLEWEELADGAKNSSSSSDSDSDSDASDASSSRGSQRDSSSSSLSDSSSSLSSSSGGYSTTASRVRHRRRRLRRRAAKQHRSSTHRPLLPLTEREHSLPIVDVDEVLSSRMLGSTTQQQQQQFASASASSPITSRASAAGMWVRHWHEASGRSYLVHSITGESVWEIVSTAASTTKQTRGDLGSSREPSGSERALSSARNAPGSARRSTPTSRDVGSLLSTGRSRIALGADDDDSGSPPTSDSEVVVTTVHSPRSGSASGRLSARHSPHHSSQHALEPAYTAATDGVGRGSEPEATTLYADSSLEVNEPHLTPHEFLLLWGALPDGGSFICRVSRTPAPQDLARHLLRNGFVIASDGLGPESLRTVHFYASVAVDMDTTDLSSSSGHNSGLRSARAPVPQFFLGEFVFDSLSLKLFAKFRCPRSDAIVPCVKKLQLKEIVGAYTPCE